MLRKIQQLRTTKKELFSGISDVRSETDRTGLRAVIELRSGTNAQKCWIASINIQTCR